VERAGDATTVTTVLTLAELSVAEIRAFKSVIDVAAVAVNGAVDAPAAMTTVPDTISCALSLISVTVVAFVAAAVRVTAQFADADAANDVDPHVTADICGVAVIAAVNLTEAFAEALFQDAVTWTSVLVSTAVEAVAVKVAETVPAAIVTEGGTFSWAFEDVKATTAPDAGAGWGRLAMQFAFAGATSDEGLHDKDIVLTGITTAIAPSVALVGIACPASDALTAPVTAIGTDALEGAAAS
jgi:hypothetical protein